MQTSACDPHDLYGEKANTYHSSTKFSFQDSCETYGHFSLRGEADSDVSDCQ